MKTGWEVRRLGDICQTGSGGTPLKAKKEYYENGTIPWLLSGEVSQGEVRSATTFITQKGFKNSSAKMFPKDTVLVAMYGATAGQVGILRFEAATNQAVCGILPSKHFVPEFLFYLLLSRKDELVAQAAGNAQPNISQIKIKNTNVPIPPLPEQQRIVGILDEAFDAIAAAKANAEKNLQNARALFESHLQAAFIQHAESAVPLSSLLSGQPRNGWSPPAEYQTGTGVPVLTLSSVTGFRYDGSRVKLSSAPTRDDAHYWLENGELLITRSNTRELVGHVAIYDGTPAKAICCDLIMKMRVNPARALTRFVFFYLRSPEARSYLTSRAQGASSTMKKIGKPVVQNMPVPNPSLAQQRSTTAKLDLLETETQRLESICRQKLAALDALKKSLLDQAFTGLL